MSVDSNKKIVLVDDLIKSLEMFRGYKVEFKINAVNLNLDKPYKYFPYTETVDNICIVDVGEDGKVVCLGYDDDRTFHRVTELEEKKEFDE